MLIPSRLLPGVVVRRETRRSLFGCLLLVDATATGIWRVPSSNPCSRASESPPIACAHADSPPPNADVNSLGTIRPFPSATASGSFPAARRDGSICRCAVGIGQVASRFDLLHASGSHLLDRPKQFQFLLAALPGNLHLTRCWIGSVQIGASALPHVLNVARTRSSG